MTNHQSKTLSDAGSARPFARPCAQGRSPSPEMFRARHRRRRPAESSAPDSIAGPGLKPRRGGLFIANVHTSLLCFCFSAVRLREYRSAEAETPPTSPISLRQLERFFAVHFAQTPGEWVRQFRCRLAQQRIRTTKEQYKNNKKQKL